MTINRATHTTRADTLFLSLVLALVARQAVMAETAHVSTGKPAASSAKTIPIPGKPTQETTAFDLVTKSFTKLSHKPITIDGYTFVPHVGKCWNVGSYKLRCGHQVLSSGKPNPHWPNSTFYSVVTPLIVPKAAVPRPGLSNAPSDIAAKMKPPLRAWAPGVSICGTGSPELVIECANCGVKCLYDYTFFSLGPKFRKLLKVNAGNDQLNFVDLGGDGSIEAIGWDQTFVCWNFGSASSPRPEVALRFLPGRAVLATEYMKAPPPTTAYMDKIVAETSTAFRPPQDGDPGGADDAAHGDLVVPYELVSNMLNLIYSGNAKAAWDFLDRVWPASNPRWQLSLSTEPLTREKFLVEFKKQLATSPYWHDIQKMNHL